MNLTDLTRNLPSESTLCRFLIVIASLSFVNLVLASQQQSDAPGGTLNVPRYDQTATRLLDGRVLIAGGLLGPTPSCEIYDPSTNRWINTGSLNLGRYSHQAVLLSDGRVFIVGGVLFGANPTGTAELYDPATGKATLTTNMLKARDAFAAALLPDGKVLVIGGAGALDLADCEVFNPATETWSPTGSLLQPRWGNKATMLLDQRVLVAGGFSQAAGLIPQCELYDPIIGSWSSCGSLNRGRIDDAQVLLADGRVLVVSGITKIGNPSTLSRTCEIYDPGTNFWTQTGKLRVPRVAFSANLLPDGRVYVVGGGDGPLSYDTVEEFRPAKGRWDALPHTLTIGRRVHTTTTLVDGSLIVAGGLNSNAETIADAELIITPR
jgi:N-acetylneuraminic acid mutarotase